MVKKVSVFSWGEGRVLGGWKGGYTELVFLFFKYIFQLVPNIIAYIIGTTDNSHFIPIYLYASHIHFCDFDHVDGCIIYMFRISYGK